MDGNGGQTDFGQAQFQTGMATQKATQRKLIRLWTEIGNSEAAMSVADDILPNKVKPLNHPRKVL